MQGLQLVIGRHAAQIWGSGGVQRIRGRGQAVLNGLLPLCRQGVYISYQCSQLIGITLLPLRQRLQHLGPSQSQSIPGSLVHIGGGLAGGESVGQFLEGLAGLGIDLLNHLEGGGGIQLQLPALMGTDQGGHVGLGIGLFVDKLVIQTVGSLDRIGDDLVEPAVGAGAAQVGNAQVADGA